MRFLGREYTGRGVSVAIIDSGINPDDPRLSGVTVDGWSITLTATGHAKLSSDFHDDNGHGTDVAAALHRLAPDARLLSVRIMGEKLGASAELMAAGIETAASNGAKVISLSIGTPNMGKALLLRDCCANAVEQGAVVLAAAHPRGDRAYPADLPEAVGVAAHQDCPVEKVFYFDPKRFPRKQWGVLSDKFLTSGHAGDPERWLAGAATSYLAGRVACLREALPHLPPEGIIEKLRAQALIPSPEIGYA